MPAINIPHWKTDPSNFFDTDRSEKQSRCFQKFLEEREAADSNVTKEKEKLLFSHCNLIACLDFL